MLKGGIKSSPDKIATPINFTHLAYNSKYDRLEIHNIDYLHLITDKCDSLVSLLVLDF